jgi:hypothetical protein
LLVRNQRSKVAQRLGSETLLASAGLKALPIDKLLPSWELSLMAQNKAPLSIICYLRGANTWA